MQMSSNTTVTELLSSGAFIEGSRGESLTDLIAVGNDREWIHDLPVSKLIERDAIIYLPNGMNLSRKGYSVALKNDFENCPSLEFDNSESGFSHLSDAMNQAANIPMTTIGTFAQEAACA